MLDDLVDDEPLARRRSNPFVTATLGVLAFVFGLGWSAKTAWFVYTAKPVTGEVTSVYRCVDWLAFFFTEYEPFTVDCAGVSWKTPVGYVGTLELKPKGAYWAGAQVPLLYDPDNQGDVRHDGFRELWLHPAFFVGIGGFFSIIGIASIRRRWSEWF